MVRKCWNRSRKGLIWPWRYKSRSPIRNREQKGHKIHILCKFESISSNPSRLIAVTVRKCWNRSWKGLIWPCSYRSRSPIRNRKQKGHFCWLIMVTVRKCRNISRQEHRYPMNRSVNAHIFKHPGLFMIYTTCDMKVHLTLKRRNPKIFFELLSGQAQIQSNHVPISRNCA